MSWEHIRILNILSTPRNEIDRNNGPVGICLSPNTMDADKDDLHFKGSMGYIARICLEKNELNAKFLSNNYGVGFRIVIFK